MKAETFGVETRVPVQNDFRFWRRKAPCAVVLALMLAFAPVATAGENLKTESRMPFLHHIPLRDAEGRMISVPPLFDAQGKPQEAAANPYSPAQTCGKCHEYDIIGRGWHFNSAKEDIKPGRPGEPWILTDPVTRTQIPLSYRGWAGTFKPAEIGMTDFDFVTTFARHLPGGGVGEPPKDKIDANDVRMRRFLVTGAMEIDCLICHDSSGHYDHDSRFRAMGMENIRWAPSIAAGLGTLGFAKSGKAAADQWRPPDPVPANPPLLKYDRARQGMENHTPFNVARQRLASSCYYCHTAESRTGDARWHSDSDVHIRAGMSCVDCHRNSVDHMVVRGYEGELGNRAVNAGMVEWRVKLIRRNDATINEADSKRLAEQQVKDEMGMVETLTCRGCHYGSGCGKPAAVRMGGRLGAPEPVHKGLPPIHLEKLSCTACHSGPFPGEAAGAVHTSLAHKLGLPAPARTDNTPPVIVQPVFLRGQDGRIAPHRMVWPAYWGHLNQGKVTPLLPAEVSKLARAKFPMLTSADMMRDPYNSKPLTNQQISDVLGALAGEASKGQAVFVAAGKLYRLDNGKLMSEEHETAKPYAWPLAHDVRPASQALGVRSCADCHSTDSPIYFGTVTSRGPVEAKNAVTQQMWALRGDNKTLASTFAFTFRFRPMLKYVSFSSAFVILAVLLAFGLAGLYSLLNNRDPHRHKKV